MYRTIPITFYPKEISFTVKELANLCYTDEQNIEKHIMAIADDSNVRWELIPEEDYNFDVDKYIYEVNAWGALFIASQFNTEFTCDVIGKINKKLNDKNEKYVIANDDILIRRLAIDDFRDNTTHEEYDSATPLNGLHKYLQKDGIDIEQDELMQLLENCGFITNCDSEKEIITTEYANNLNLMRWQYEPYDPKEKEMRSRLVLNPSGYILLKDYVEKELKLRRLKK